MVNQIIGRLRRMSPMKIIFLGYCVIVLMGHAVAFPAGGYPNGAAIIVFRRLFYRYLCHLCDRPGPV